MKTLAFHLSWLFNWLLASWLGHKSWKGEVPGSSQNRWISFLVFALKQTSLSTLTGEKLKLHQIVSK